MIDTHILFINYKYRVILIDSLFCKSTSNLAGKLFLP